MLNLRGQDILIPSHLLFTAKELFQLKQFCTLNVVQEHSLASFVSCPVRALNNSKLFVSISSHLLDLPLSNCLHVFIFISVTKRYRPWKKLAFYFAGFILVPLFQYSLPFTLLCWSQVHNSNSWAFGFSTRCIIICVCSEAIWTDLPDGDEFHMW